ncbi:helix-turn-helix domain-containing protein [Kitasatospora sp. NPDC057904]|uniref:helix-turn-helix domain-containing protein n=1 Tax=unclassified Kitasatospora TaxID=2633591 RepID=UPI0036D7BBC5
MSDTTSVRRDGERETARLSERLREMRSLTKKSLKDLERVTMVSDSSWSRYLAGRGLPPWAAVEALCREVGRDPEDLRLLWEAAAASRTEQERPPQTADDVGPGTAGTVVPVRRRRSWLVLAAAAVTLLGVLVSALVPALRDGGTGSSAPQADPKPDGPAFGASPPAPRTATAVPGAIRADAAVPEQFRGAIELAARRCTEAEVTPALLAAMLKVESGFDPDLRDPKADEYGIARWTPAVFNAWAVDGNGDGVKDYMSPADAIATMGLYTCWLDQRIKQSGLHTNLPGLIAAAYRTSDKAVIQAEGPPEGTAAYVADVLRYQEQFATR